jgi:septum formation protein
MSAAGDRTRTDDPRCCDGAVLLFPDDSMTPARQLILASTSPYRRELLARLGVPFTCAAPPYVEEHDLAVAPEALVVELARRKAKSLAGQYPDALVLAADQVAEVDGELLTKPKTAERAVAQLLRLRGRSHRLLTGVVVLDTGSGRLEHALDVQVLEMRDVSDAQIEGYVAREQPLDCAGAYRIEGPGIALFASMQGTDYTGIIGLPLCRVVLLLARFGVSVP